MKKLIVPAILLVLAVLAVVSYSQSVSPMPYVLPWSNRSYRANKADSVKDQAGNYKPVWQIIAADSALWARTADTAWTLQGKDTTWIKGLTPASVGNADSLGHAAPDFGVDLLAESLAVKAPLANPGFTGRIKGDTLVVTTTTGDSVLVYSTAAGPDTSFVIFVSNGFRNPLFMLSDSAIYAGYYEDTTTHENNIGNKLIDKYGKIIQFGHYYPYNYEQAVVLAPYHENPWRLGMRLSSGFAGDAEAEDTIYIGASRYRVYDGVGGKKRKWEYTDIMRITQDSVVFNSSVGLMAPPNINGWCFWSDAYPSVQYSILAGSTACHPSGRPVWGLGDITGSQNNLGLYTLYGGIDLYANQDSGLVFNCHNVSEWRAVACSLMVKTTDDSVFMLSNKPARYSGGGKSITIDDTLKATKGMSTGGGTMLTGIYTGNATGWTTQNTIDTNVVSGATATSRISLTFRAATATLTAPICGRTTTDTLFISCAAADTSAVRQGSVDYLIFR